MLVPFYQPLVRLDTGEIWGFEPLARWRHPERGIVSPAEFIPLAEESGLIGRLGDVILEVTETSIMRATHRIDELRQLGLTVVAEGIETEEQLRRVRDMGCTIGQGYLFSRPPPAAEIDPLLEQQDRRQMIGPEGEAAGQPDGEEGASGA